MEEWNGFHTSKRTIVKWNEKKYLCECIDTGWISSEGSFVKEFERKFSETVHRNYGVAVSNGTAALGGRCTGAGNRRRR